MQTMSRPVWTLLLLQILVVGCTSVSGACAYDVPELNGLNLRSVNNKATADGHHIKDSHLATGWYSTVSSAGKFYRMSSMELDGLPDLGQCGTSNPIYIDGTLPNLSDDEEVRAKACYVTWDDNCAVRLDIKVRRCSGRPQYYLSPPQGVSGYCFEPEERKDAPSYFLPKSPSVIVGMAYEKEINQYYVPHLEFTCDFPVDQRLFYYIQWFVRVGHDDKIIQAFELTRNLTSTKLLEKHLLDNNISLGTTVLTPTITIDKGKTGVLTLQQTVPVGCVGEICSPKISLYDKNDPQTCNSALAVKGSYCGHNLKAFTYRQIHNGTSFYPHNLSMKVTTKEKISYTMKASFDISLQTEDYGNSHQIWKNYSIDSVHVNVAENDTWKEKHCHCTADPQFDTFDGSLYYPSQKENIGEYLLYENTANGIQVQYKTFRCSGGTCTCGVVVRAGGDLWMYSTCNEADYIGFTSCNDGLLTVDKISLTSYQIHTPSGTYIWVRMHVDEFNMASNYLDIDVYASPSDLERTRGHCGTLNGNRTDDISKPSGELITSNYWSNIDDFYESWRVSGNTNYFDINNLNPPSWDTARESCVCIQDSDLHLEVHCSADDNYVCFNPNPNPVCNSRRKRSTYRQRRYIDRVFERMQTMMTNDHDIEKRSTSIVSYDEAYAECLEFFSNQTIYALRNSVPDSRLNNFLRSCADDATIDITQTAWMKSHFESWASTIENEIIRNITYRTTRPAEMKQFQDIRCSDDCFGNGRCVKGVCQCNPGYSGNTCFINMSDVLEITDIEGGGECDVKEDSQCHECLQVKSRYLLEDFMCNISVTEFEKDGQERQLGQFERVGEYENLFEGHCCPKLESGRHRRSVSTTGSFVTKYMVSISNDGIHYGPSRQVYVFDSTCQEYVVLPNGDLLFSLKQEACFIDGMCYLKGAKSNPNSCNTCWPDKSKYTWTQECNPDGNTITYEEDSGRHVKLIVAVSVTASVMLGVGLVFIVWKLKRRMRREVWVLKNTPPAYENMPSFIRFDTSSSQVDVTTEDLR